MNRIAKLLAELSPNGVESHAIGEVADCYSGATPASGDADFWENGTIPWMSSGEVNKGTIYSTDKLISQAGFDSCSTRMVPPGAVVMALAGQGKTRGTVARTRIALCTNQSLCAIVPSPALDADFLFHFLSTQYQQLRDVSSGAGARGGLNLGIIRAYPIPLPPLEVQRETVRVLDRLSCVEADLEAKLEAELRARRLQYAHYLERVLTFPEAGGARIPLNELGEFVRGRRFTKADVAVAGVPSIHYGEIYTSYGVAAEQTVSHVRADLRPQLRFANPGDVVIAAVGETVEDVGKAVAWLGSEPVAIHDDTFLFRSELNPKYVSYFMQTADFHAQKNKYVARAKVKRLSSEGLAKISIPVPSVEEQSRVVEILDKFDALVNDLNSGLPAEIAARRKQYEYYRDKLLSFDEAVA
jgi:type I restriction enzyme S subunit